MEHIPHIDRVLTASEARMRFDEAGLSIAEWARKKRFSTGLVYQVLAGRNKASRGQSHRIAIALGMKRGTASGEVSF